MTQITKAQSLEAFRALIGEVNSLTDTSVKQGSPDWGGWTRWHTAACSSIEIVFGAGHQNLIKFQQLKYNQPKLPETATNAGDLVYFILGLKFAREMLEGMLFSIAVWWPSDDVKNRQAVMFISHGGKRVKKPLSKIKEFLVTLGASPIDVEELPNIGKTLDDKIDIYLKQCNCGLVLLTGEDRTTKGEWRARPNIDHEVGSLQKSPNIENKIIYFKEKTVTLPSNFRNIAWYDFNFNQLDSVFTKILKELKAFGF